MNSKAYFHKKNNERKTLRDGLMEEEENLLFVFSKFRVCVMKGYLPALSAQKTLRSSMWFKKKTLSIFDRYLPEVSP